MSRSLALGAARRRAHARTREAAAGLARAVELVQGRCEGCYGLPSGGER
jgi:hypothetical protein